MTPPPAPVLAGLLGHPVAHSRSPDLFAAAWSAAGVSGRYELVDVAPAALGAAVGRTRAEAWLGFNVTVPHKQAVIAHLDGLAASARATGAVNCAVRGPDGALVGHNTDAAAFIASLRADARFAPDGRASLLLGAGGAARAVAWALAGQGARVEASARRPDAAAALPGVTALRPWTAPIPLHALELIVNCTPLGMAAAAGDDPWRGRLDWASLPRRALVADLVYAPERTPLLAAAERRGLPTLGGLGMLVRQAETSFRLWLGEPPPTGAMALAARDPSTRG